MHSTPTTTQENIPLDFNPSESIELKVKKLKSHTLIPTPSKDFSKYNSTHNSK